MKTKILIVVFFLISQFSFTQTEQDYEAVVENVTKLFNNKEATTIFELLSPSYQAKLPVEAMKAKLDGMHDSLGKITSYEYWMEGEQGVGYTLEFEKATMIILIKLDKNKKVDNMTLEEY